ncbi:unnamed protein product [Spodoptera exigua]|uniref:Uncharacterized protein n=1 Tax=Spodoptera exigua TaxID=7107 RepID=A0A835GGU6_SPOEX|nr:hypothetical protein HW555_007583 [Spodoptera exigua]CAH0700715.1 unnamed protein product [Spodoptera exigua]
MGRMSGIKWEKATQCRPVHNIISSDFPKYNPQPWKFMEGKSRIEWLLSYEYQRMWIKEIEAWKKRMYPESTTVNVDVVKRYVLTFKTNHQPAKPEKKKPFKIKKFEGIKGKLDSKRPPNDKAMRGSMDQQNSKKI